MVEPNCWIRFISTIAFILSFLCLSPVSALAQPTFGCGNVFEALSGPWDVRITTGEPGYYRKVVEKNHFYLAVQNLTDINPGGNLDFTLRAFPNHTRALATLVRLAEKQGSPQPKGTNWPVECYFERAVQFAPDDVDVRILYGLYLLKQSRPKQAREQLELADANLKDGGTPNTNYNLGLAFAKLGDYDRALKYAQAAYAAGFPLPGLKNQLVKAGKWREPSPAAASAPPVVPEAKE